MRIYRENKMQATKKQIEKWIAIGKNNPWISEAWDPEFDENSFHRCRDMNELIEKFRDGNWCLGQAFWIEISGHKFCFINQINGGDEWLTIRNDVAFESCSMQHMIGPIPGRFGLLTSMQQWIAATDEQLRKLDF